MTTDVGNVVAGAARAANRVLPHDVVETRDAADIEFEVVADLLTAIDRGACGAARGGVAAIIVAVVLIEDRPCVVDVEYLARERRAQDVVRTECEGLQEHVLRATLGACS